MLTVALMMASPPKHVSITMDEKRPLLEAQVNTATPSLSYFPLFTSKKKFDC